MSPRAYIVALVGGIWIAVACSESSAPSPFVLGGPAQAGAAGSAPAPTASSILNREPTLGGPCTEDAQCDDQVACTTDRCDPDVGRCRFSPSDFACTDDVYCDGGEYCDNELGCREGDPVACSDGVTCTLDACDEAKRTCEHLPRDADGDGDPVWNCTGGGDCDDTDPRISSKTVEVCDNARDDDCDTQADELECVRPQHDICADPLVIGTSGSYSLALAAAKSDYALSCGTTQTADATEAPFRDVVVALQIPAGAPQDVEVVATSVSGDLKLGASEVCGKAETETRCVGSFLLAQAGSMARTKLRGLAAGVHPVYVFSTADAPVVLDVRFSPASAPPINENCQTVLPLVPGVPVLVSLVDVASELGSGCVSNTSAAAAFPAGELVYRFDLQASQDVRLFAVSEGDLFTPIVSLRDTTCQVSEPPTPESASELTCRRGNNSELFVRALGPGSYFVAVSATGPADVTLSLELGPPTSAPADSRCDMAPALTPNQPNMIAFSGHTDAVQASCLSGAVDASYALKLDSPSDVLLVTEAARGDTTSLGLFENQCDAESRVRCRASSVSPLRVAVSGVAPGSYRVVVESALGASTTLTPWVRKAVPAVVVPSGDDCANVFQIPATGGVFLGNTANMNADFEASCDYGSLLKGGAGDQLLKLSLTEKSRVVIDADASGYLILLNLRQGPECPGKEVPEACAASGFVKNELFLSFMDLTLEPGDYFLQVDGYSDYVGPWAVNVFIAKAP